MMAVTVTNYGLFLQSLVEGRVNLSVDELWTMLVGSGYAFNQHTQKYKSVVTGELVGSGYAAGGQKTTFSTPIYTSSTKILNVPAGNMAWPSVSFTGAVGAVLYVKKAGFAEDSWPLVSYMNFGESINRSNQAFYINWPTNGAMKLFVP